MPHGRLHHTHQTTLDALIQRGERGGLVWESELERVADRLRFDPLAVEALREALADRGVPVEDDCGRPAQPRGTPRARLRTTRSTASSSSSPAPRGSRC